MDPLVFEPYYRPQIWGGRGLAEILGRPLPDDGSYGESWEISGHQHHVSRLVAESVNPPGGISLTDLCRDHATAIFGTAVPSDGQFPLLVKILDCHRTLSIQVHPDDATAKQLGIPDRGKTESWVVLDVRPEGRIYAGLKEGVTRSDLEQHLAAGTTEECLHWFAPQPGDCLFIRAGTVHAVGGGVLMAEVQQSSDATFRLFDWNRVGADGQPRPLHIRESLEAIDWDMGPQAPVTIEPATGQLATGQPASGQPASGQATSAAEASREVRREQLVRCDHFTMDRWHAAGTFDQPGGQFALWMVLEGSASLSVPASGYQRLLRRGDTVLVPAAASDTRWELGPEAAALTLLQVQLPDEKH